jgi:hypothetical protein
MTTNLLARHRGGGKPGFDQCMIHGFWVWLDFLFDFDGAND